MLDQLIRYGQRSGMVSEPGFAPRDVKWAIVCDTEGRHPRVVELGEPGPKNKGRRFERCPNLTQSEIAAGGQESRRHFLVDNVSVVANMCSTDKDRKKVAAKHQFFRRLVSEAAKVVASLRPVATLLADDSAMEAVRQDLLAHKAKESEWATFQVDSIFPVESDEWHQWWREWRKGLIRNPDQPRTGHIVRSLVSGEPVKPAATHDKVKGPRAVGFMGQGNSLVSFDKPAFESYGFGQSANAAMSECEAKTYVDALNDLIRTRGRRLAGAVVVSWFDRDVPDEEDPVSWLEAGTDQRERDALKWADELLTAIRDGRRSDLGASRYFALTLSGVGGRVMVRDWMEGAFEGLVANVKSWFDDLAIVDRDGAAVARSPKFLAVLGGTVRDLKDLPPPLVSRMWRVAVRAEPIPESLLARALERTRTCIVLGEGFNVARMGLLKAYHVRKARREGGKTMTGEITPTLTEDHPNPAYHCGRLLAVLARLQEAALGDVGAGVVQRYYAAASATPALVLGRLVRTSQFHLSKIKSQGLAHWYEERIAAVLGRLGDGVPRTLDLEEQSLFALGYYQQWADMRRSKRTDDVKDSPIGEGSDSNEQGGQS